MASSGVYSVEKRREWSRRYANSAHGRSKSRLWRKANPDKIAELHRRSWQKKREMIRAAKSRPCEDCGVQYGYWVMQFDHVPGRGPKLFLMNHGILNRSYKIISEEIAKCDVVCANCHFEREHKRREEACREQ